MSTTSPPLHRELPHADDELMTLKEVATLVRVPEATLRYWRHFRTGPTASGLPDQHRDDSLRCFPPDSHELAERFRRRWAPSRHQGGPGRLFVNREFLQLLVRAEPSTKGLRTDGREGRHLHVSIPADAGGDPRHVKKLDRSPKHAKIRQSFLHVSSQAIVDRGDPLRRRSEYLNTHER